MVKKAKSGSKGAKKESKSVSNAKSVAPPPAPTPVVEKVVEEAAPESVEPTLSDNFGEFMTKLQQLSSLMGSLKTEFRVLEKRANREMKAAQRQQNKRKRKTTNRAPSGFVKPTLISDELANFLGKDTGTEMARTEVTREINAYIRKHSLQDSDNGRKINADGPLQKLLRLTKSDELTYFNLQRYMSPHFAKGGNPPLASAASF
jgi:chromatin remodeling complex protein RSC6